MLEDRGRTCMNDARQMQELVFWCMYCGYVPIRKTLCAGMIKTGVDTDFVEPVRS